MYETKNDSPCLDFISVKTSTAIAHLRPTGHLRAIFGTCAHCGTLPLAPRATTSLGSSLCHLGSSRWGLFGPSSKPLGAFFGPSSRRLRSFVPCWGHLPCHLGSPRGPPGPSSKLSGPSSANLRAIFGLSSGSSGQRSLRASAEQGGKRVSA